MSDFPNTLWLFDMGDEIVWCNCPAPGLNQEPGESVRYKRVGMGEEHPDTAIDLRVSKLRQDTHALYQTIRKDLQTTHLQTIAFAPGITLTEDALQRWRRGDVKQPDLVHLIQVASYLGYTVTLVNDLSETYTE